MLRRAIPRWFLVPCLCSSSSSWLSLKSEPLAVHAVNRYVLCAIGLVMLFQLLFTYTAPMSWLRILVVGASVLFVVELEKWLVRSLATETGQNGVSE